MSASWGFSRENYHVVGAFPMPVDHGGIFLEPDSYGMGEEYEGYFGLRGYWLLAQPVPCEEGKNFVSLPSVISMHAKQSLLDAGSRLHVIDHGTTRMNRVNHKHKVIAKRRVSTTPFMKGDFISVLRFHVA